ncbi:hypothetical protein [Effusibacillus lacus]|uniref:hypothetical protein n=1 Tax=Effusibacillus lacus TaxID=1348429 RepID=UPI0014051459|nr:hypothetical protein [Effusibacillus lacus]
MLANFFAQNLPFIAKNMAILRKNRRKRQEIHETRRISMDIAWFIIEKSAFDAMTIDRREIDHGFKEMDGRGSYGCHAADTGVYNGSGKY